MGLRATLPNHISACRSEFFFKWQLNHSSANFCSGEWVAFFPRVRICISVFEQDMPSFLESRSNCKGKCKNKKCLNIHFMRSWPWPIIITESEGTLIEFQKEETASRNQRLWELAITTEFKWNMKRRRNLSLSFY